MMTNGKTENPMFKASIIATFLLSLVVRGSVANAGDREFYIDHDESSRFVMIERLGNAPDIDGNITGAERCAYVTVFEYLGEDLPLRKLYETELLTTSWPAAYCLSPDGRFLVTYEWFHHAGISPHSLVVYDLARKELTAYAGKDFLDEETIKGLRSNVGGTDGSSFYWTDNDVVFNQSSTKFYPTLPSNCKEEFPFVVVDLPTRKATVEPLPSEDPKDLVHRAGAKWGWKPSSETVATENTILPVSLTRKRVAPRGVHTPERVYRLSDDHTEYVPDKMDLPGEPDPK